MNPNQKSRAVATYLAPILAYCDKLDLNREAYSPALIAKLIDELDWPWLATDAEPYEDTKPGFRLVAAHYMPRGMAYMADVVAEWFGLDARIDEFDRSARLDEYLVYIWRPDKGPTQPMRWSEFDRLGGAQ